MVQPTTGAGLNQTVDKRMSINRLLDLEIESFKMLAQLSLAWVLHQDTVDAPIVETASIKHLEEAVKALEIDLTEWDQDYLEEPVGPFEVASHE